MSGFLAGFSYSTFLAAGARAVYLCIRHAYVDISSGILAAASMRASTALGVGKEEEITGFNPFEAGWRWALLKMIDDITHRDREVNFYLAVRLVTGSETGSETGLASEPAIGSVTGLAAGSG